MKIKLILITFFSLFLLSACQVVNKNETDSTPSVTFTDPFVQVGNLEEAVDRVGFGLNLPEKIDGYQQDLIEVMDNKMIQLYYRSDNDNQIVIRKAIFVEGIDDISGDGEEYESELTHDYNLDGDDEDEDNSNTISVTLKGNDKNFNLAYWRNGDYLYSLYTSQGMMESTIRDLVKEIN